MAHITGGGLEDNIPRMLPKHLAAEVDASAWPVPDVLLWLKQAGNVSSREFARTWNTGLGMVIVVKASLAQEATAALQDAGERVHTIGKLIARKDEGVVLSNTQGWEQ
jgi:homoserine kinase